MIDSSVIIDHLNGAHAMATEIMLGALKRGDELYSSTIVRVEVLAGMRPGEEIATTAALDLITWVALDTQQADVAGELGRRYLRSHRGVEAPDLVIAALAKQLGARVVTRNVKHFPMFTGLRAPY